MQNIKTLLPCLCYPLAIVATVISSVIPLQAITKTTDTQVVTLLSSKRNDIQLQAKQNLVSIEIPANATSGYQWHITKIDQSIFTLISHQYAPPNSKELGAVGEQIFTFKLNVNAYNKLPSKIVFSYYRDWQKNDKNTQTKSVTISKNTINDK